jgi:hypothetical protein
MLFVLYAFTICGKKLDVVRIAARTPTIETSMSGFRICLSRISITQDDLP